MSFNLDIKTSDILKKAVDNVKKKLEKDLQRVAQQLAKGAAKKAGELAENKLPEKLKDIYKENLYTEQLSDNVFVVGIRPDARWIEHGVKPGFMDYLLKGNNVKISKDGLKYKVIPFKHDTGNKKSQKSGSGTDQMKELKTFLKSEGFAHSKTRALALDDKGSPRVGKIHSFDIKGMREKGKKSAKKLSPNLHGVSIFQNMNEDTGKVERNIMTFRVISEKHKGSKWMHPGRKGEKIMVETHKWVVDTWQREILPELKRKYEKKG